MKTFKRQFIEKYISINTIDAHVELLEQELLEAIEKDDVLSKPMFVSSGNHYLVPCDLVDEWQNGDSIKQLIHDIQKCKKTIYNTPKS